SDQGLRSELESRDPAKTKCQHAPLCHPSVTHRSLPPSSNIARGGRSPITLRCSSSTLIAPRRARPLCSLPIIWVAYYLGGREAASPLKGTQSCQEKPEAFAPGRAPRGGAPPRP